MAVRTTARITAFIPGASPPEVSTPIVSGLFLSILLISLNQKGIEIARYHRIWMNRLRLLQNVLLTVTPRNMRQDQLPDIGFDGQLRALLGGEVGKLLCHLSFLIEVRRLDDQR